MVSSKGDGASPDKISMFCNFTDEEILLILTTTTTTTTYYTSFVNYLKKFFC
jgi:hypothetical protein